MPMTYESQEKTATSWLKAMREITQYCPYLSRVGSGSSVGLFSEFQADFGVDKSKLLPQATSVSVEIAELFYCRAPKIISAEFHVWRAAFVIVRFMMERLYEEYEWEFGHAAQTDEDGNVVKPSLPAKFTATPRSIRVYWDGPRWGLGQWSEKVHEHRRFCDTCRDDVRDAYIARIDTASEQVRQWREALKATVVELAEFAKGGES